MRRSKTEKNGFYNKCWGQVVSLAPTFIIEPIKIVPEFFSGTTCDYLGNSD